MQSKSLNAASRFTRRIKLERPVTSQDSIGDTLTTWVTEAEVWADIQPRTGSEIYENHGVREKITHDVTIRYRQGVAPSWRIVYGMRIMQIHAVINVEERQEVLLLKAEERRSLI